MYCDMTTEGGGWTLVASVSGARRRHTYADATTPLREHPAPNNHTGYKLADVDINAIVTDRYRFKCATCTLFFEPIAFDASGDSACKLQHRWGTDASAYEGSGSCESNRAGTQTRACRADRTMRRRAAGTSNITATGSAGVTFPPSVTDKTANSGFDD